MGKVQKQNIIDINNIVFSLQSEYTEKIKNFAEKLLDINLLSVAPDLSTDIDDLDVTEKLMLLREFSLSEEERSKEKEEAISFEEALKEDGLKIDDLHD